MSMPEQSGDSFDFCVLFRVYFTGKGAVADVTGNYTATCYVRGTNLLVQYELNYSASDDYCPQACSQFLPGYLSVWNYYTSFFLFVEFVCLL